MTPTTFVLLHGAAGPEIASLEYLSRVVLYLLAFGGVAAIALWGTDAVRRVRFGVAAKRDSRENDP